MDERSADLYGLDVGIFFGSDDLQWRNATFEGCGAGAAEDEGASVPTAEEREAFQRAVQISEELVALGAAQGN